MRSLVKRLEREISKLSNLSHNDDAAILNDQSPYTVSAPRNAAQYAEWSLHLREANMGQLAEQSISILAYSMRFKKQG